MRRCKVTAALERPYGRGVNFQIRTTDARALHAAVVAAGAPLIIDLEERWYRQDVQEAGNRQFVVADPDGCLLRFFDDLGSRPGPWPSSG